MTKRAKSSVKEKTATRNRENHKRHQERFKAAERQNRANVDGYSPAWVMEQLAQGSQKFLQRKYKDLGDFLIAIRCWLNLPPDKFAAKLGMSVDELAELERAKYHGVTARFIRSILWSLGGNRSVTANILCMKRNMIASRLRETRAYLAALRRDQAIARDPRTSKAND